METVQFLFKILVLFCLFSTTICDLFTSVYRLKEAVIEAKAKNGELKDLLKSYVDEQLLRMERAERLIDELQDFSGDEIKDPTFKITHPLNAFRFIRNHSDIFNSTLEKAVGEISTFETETSTKFEINVTKLTENLPKADDFNGSAVAVNRIQSVYAFSTAAIADGSFINATQSNLTGVETRDISTMLHGTKLYVNGRKWLKEAKNRLRKENVSEAAIEHVMRIAALASLKTGNFYAAFYAIAGHTQRTYVDRKTKLLVNRIKSELKDFRKNAKPDDVKTMAQLANQPTRLDPTYHLLCSGKSMEKREDETPLFCRYEDNGHPYFMLQPLKYEQISKEPYIVLYHEAFSEKDIEHIKGQAKPVLTRSNTGNPGVGHHSKIRISSSATVVNNTDKLISKVKAITTLKAGYETIQVANYGIGGYYASHYDAFSNLNNTGNRMATFMVYLTDVESGGATIFPKAKLTIFPKKGMAVFWGNLRGNRIDKDVNTNHSACPVIKGDKWVSTFWIWNKGNEFTWPCTLNE